MSDTNPEVGAERYLAYRWYDPQLARTTGNGDVKFGKPAIDIRVRFDETRQDPQHIGWELEYALRAMVIAMQTGSEALDHTDPATETDTPTETATEQQAAPAEETPQ